MDYIYKKKTIIKVLQENKGKNFFSKFWGKKNLLRKNTLSSRHKEQTMLKIKNTDTMKESISKLKERYSLVENICDIYEFRMLTIFHYFK